MPCELWEMTGYHAPGAMRNVVLIITDCGNSFYRVATRKSAVRDVLVFCFRRPVFQCCQSQSFGVEVGLELAPATLGELRPHQRWRQPCSKPPFGPARAVLTRANTRLRRAQNQH